MSNVQSNEAVMTGIREVMEAFQASIHSMLTTVQRDFVAALKSASIGPPASQGGTVAPAHREQCVQPQDSSHPRESAASLASGSGSQPQARSTTLWQHKDHLRYVVLGFLKKQKENDGIQLENGSFPGTVTWWDLFLAGLEDDEQTYAALGQPSPRIDEIPAPGELKRDEGLIEEHKGIVERLRDLRTAREELTVVEMCSEADPHHSLIPWNLLLPQERAEVERAHSDWENAEPVTLFGPISCIKCDCPGGEEQCKWRKAEQIDRTRKHVYTVAWGHVWCVGTQNREQCRCRRGTVRVKVDAQGVATCSTLSVVGLPVVGGVPEGVLQEGGEYYWELCMVGVRETYRNQPAKKQGRPPNKASGKKRLGNGSTKRKQGTKQTAGQKDMPQPDTQADTEPDTEPDPQPRRKSVRASVPSVRARNRDSDPQSDDH